MSTILDRIIEHKREEVAVLKRNGTAAFKGVKQDHRPFAQALRSAVQPAIIAEVKKASPSKGILRADFDHRAIARSYERGGADAISVLTDEYFFQGSPAYLIDVRETVSLPVLRKDFIIDPVQVQQTAVMGADAMLLIAAALDGGQMKELYDAAREFGIESLIEVHTRPELERVLALAPAVIGINNRDLSTFTTDISVTLSLLKEIPPGTVIVSESGIGDSAQAQRLRDAGVTALLVGESLMKADDPGKLIRELKSQRAGCEKPGIVKK